MEKFTEMNTVRIRKTRIYLPHFFYQSCKVVVVNWELPSLHGGSLKITLTVPLKSINIFLSVNAYILRKKKVVKFVGFLN